MDIAISLGAIVLIFPLLLVVMGAIKLAIGGPVVFSHFRIGYNGRPFRCYKLRTMVTNSDDVLHQHLTGNPTAAREWLEHRKLRHDPRVTFLGQMLRKSSIDELPQLINVLRGDMSCVGPRPVVADELERYGPYVTEYLKARPGLTGLWQVSGRNQLSYEDRIALDCQYVRGWSISADFAILFKTIFVVTNFDETA
jgi:exopolysaccharide production protein ExoY